LKQGALSLADRLRGRALHVSEVHLDIEKRRSRCVLGAEHCRPIESYADAAAGHQHGKAVTKGSLKGPWVNVE